MSPYLPLNLAPEIERQIERVLILADKPVMSRPIAAATVLDALPAACARDEVLCKRVRRYLNRYMDKRGIANVSAEVALTDGVTSLPNRHGMLSDSAWDVAADAYMRVGDYALISVGGVANDEDATPTGTMLSLGFEYAQLDVGYRDHWFSPFSDSAMLISTEAHTMRSVTLSNYTPISFVGLQYEVFLAEMDKSKRIAYRSTRPDGTVVEGLSEGHPRLAGLRIAIEPVTGWSLAANRVMQFGGGARGGAGFNAFFDALLRPHEFDNASDNLDLGQEFGNQVAAWTSRFVFPGKTPFAAYLEYAGEDSSYEGNFRLGNASLSMGLTFPQLWQRFDLTYEVSEWQNAWYVHGIYGDGLTNDGYVLGHWGADRRAVGDGVGVGAQSHMLRVGWEPGFGGLLQLRARTLENENYTANDYERAYDLTVSYSRAIQGFTAGGEVTAGRDVFGDSFSRIAGFVRFGDEWASGASGVDVGDFQRPDGADLFVDTGVNASRVTIRIGDGSPKRTTSNEIAPHIGIGARRAVSEHQDLGVRAEIDRIDGELLLAVRALDYRYRFDNPLALTAFVGAARYDLATPAYGYYIGGGAQWRDVMPHFDVSVDLRYMDKVARDKLPTDAGFAFALRPDAFYDITGATLSLSYRF